ncbi:deoxycytidylate deaminase [Minwuia thermotolerans]|uniref:dCMP deaminase n=1 Tax=Minwuia thermotolerans TaxID=2056226 RepID=A0A2M9FZP8_9PROT|nr:deaminase [Minwuia thermotolerans]PJK28936.1 dCMP deaminase [Minwuia thermotolerans]
MNIDQNHLSEPTKWDIRFMKLADFIAEWSEDSSRKVGAIIVGPANEIRSTGFNGLARGINATPHQRHSREDNEKYYWYEHAERNSIYNMARAGISSENCRIYTSLFPCSDCTRAIIQSGLAEIITRLPPNRDDFFSRSLQISLEMLNESHVSVRFLKI